MSIKWDIRYLELAKFISAWSRDPSTKVGAVIVRPDKTIAGTGFNGFPRGMDDNTAFYINREEKYSRIIHAELNALLSCTDQHLKGYTCYGTFPPCDRCFVHLANVGIKRFVSITPTSEQLTRWGEMFAKTTKYAHEMSIELVEFTLP